VLATWDRAGGRLCHRLGDPIRLLLVGIARMADAPLQLWRLGGGRWLHGDLAEIVGQPLGVVQRRAGRRSRWRLRERIVVRLEEELIWLVGGD
jgi:hypothetical protein